MSISDDVLMAYADGELDTKTRAQVEEAIAADPQVARRVAEHTALRNRLRATYDRVLDDPIPDRLLAAARAGAPPQSREPAAPSQPTAAAQPRGVVVPLRPRHAKAPSSVPYWGAIAASFVVGALVWHYGGRLYSPESGSQPTSTAGSVLERDGQLLASGALDKALSDQLVKDQQAQSPVQIGVSFRSKGGNYCRTFRLQQGNNLAGLACREQGQWKLEVLAQGESPTAGHPEFRPAGSSMPATIAQAVDQSIEGEPLDASAEAHAKANNWRP